MTPAPPPDALVDAVALVIGRHPLHSDDRGEDNLVLHDAFNGDYDQRTEAVYAVATAALSICRAHFAAMARAHGAAIRARIDMGDSDATAARFEQRALVAHEIAELIEGKST